MMQIVETEAQSDDGLISHSLCHVKGIIITRAARMVLFFLVVSICVWLCFVCQHDNSWTVRDIITKFSGHHPMVERADMFENGCIGVRGRWFNVSDVQVPQMILGEWGWIVMVLVTATRSAEMMLTTRACVRRTRAERFLASVFDWRRTAVNRPGPGVTQALDSLTASRSVTRTIAVS